MRTLLAALVSAGFIAFGSSSIYAQTAEDAFGTWFDPENNSNISVFSCAGGLCAKVIKVTDLSRRDDNNPAPMQRGRSIEGMIIMEGAKKTADKTWSGKLYNSQDGKTYDGTLTVIDKTHLKFQGCVVGSSICKGPTWTRVD